MSLSTLAGLGAICVAVKLLFLLLEARGLAADCLHADDTTVPLLAKLKTEAELGLCARRSPIRWSRTTGGAVLLLTQSQRRTSRVHLAAYSLILQVDKFARFNDLVREGRGETPMTRLNYCVHGRREFFKLVDIRQQMKRTRGAAPLTSPLAGEALARIDQLFAIERDVNGKPAAELLADRRELSVPIVAELEIWMRGTRANLSRHDAVTTAIKYSLNDWEGFTTFLADGRFCLTNNAAERERRVVNRGSKAWLFVRSDRDG